MSCASYGSKGLGHEITLETPTFTAGGPGQIRLEPAKGSIPAGHTRLVTAIDLSIDAQFDTDADGTAAARRLFNVITQLNLGTRGMGMLYVGMPARSIRQLWRNRTGKRVTADAAALTAAGANQARRYVCRLMFADPGLKDPYDRCVPIHLLNDTIDLSYGQAVADISDGGAAGDVAIDFVTIRPTLRYLDVEEEVLPRMWQVRRDTFGSATMALPQGDYITNFMDEVDESMTDAEVGSVQVDGYHLAPVHPQQLWAGWNGDYAHTAADELTVNAYDHVPFIRLPGPVGFQSSGDAFGTGGPVQTVRLTGGTDTTPEVVSLYHPPSSRAQREAAIQIAFPGRDLSPGGAHVLKAKTRSKAPVPLDSRIGANVPWKVMGRVQAANAATKRRAAMGVAAKSPLK